MKTSNQLQVINQNLQSANVAIARQPDQKRTEDLAFGIVHESFDKEVNAMGTIITEPEDLAKACSCRSGNGIYLTALHFKYRFELNNNVLLNQYGEGFKMKMVLVIEKYE